MDIKSTTLPCATYGAITVQRQMNSTSLFIEHLEDIARENELGDDKIIIASFPYRNMSWGGVMRRRTTGWSKNILNCGRWWRRKHGQGITGNQARGRGRAVAAAGGYQATEGGLSSPEDAVIDQAAAYPAASTRAGGGWRRRRRCRGVHRAVVRIVREPRPPALRRRL